MGKGQTDHLSLLSPLVCQDKPPWSEDVHSSLGRGASLWPGELLLPLYTAVVRLSASTSCSVSLRERGVSSSNSGNKLNTAWKSNSGKLVKYIGFILAKKYHVESLMLCEDTVCWKRDIREKQDFNFIKTKESIKLLTVSFDGIVGDF